MGYVSFRKREGNILSPQNGGLVQRIFLSVWVMFSFQPLIFRAVTMLYLDVPGSQ